MASDCDITQEAILAFLKEKGGKVKNKELVDHFQAVFPEEPARKAAARSTFKNYVDNIAFVKAESGVKYVCLKKKFRTSVTEGQSARRTETAPARATSPTRADRAEARCDDAAEEPEVLEVRHRIPPGSGYGSESQVTVPRVCSIEPASPNKPDAGSKCHEFVCVRDGVNDGMGNRGSVRRDRRESKKKAGETPAIPEIAVIEASPLPAAGPVFALPGPVQTGATGQVGTSPPAGLPPTGRRVETELLSLESPKEAKQIRPEKSSESQLQPSEGEDDGQLDSGSEGNASPRSSRTHFIELMMSSSPQVRRSIVFSSLCDSDSVSLVSSNLDDDRASVALDPLEHEWMMCASDGQWDSLSRLLATEPSLVLRKDFVTGFTCLHWAAKHGKPELLALIINFAKQHDVPISVDARSNTGYTPLHVAAMHNHMEVVKLLVGAYNADVEVRDYSGRKACQYLTDNVSVDIRDIIGAYEHSEAQSADRGSRWRFSKVLQANLRPLKPLKLLSPDDCDGGEVRPREKPIRRKSSFSRMRPKLERLRVRTSQIVHSTSFHDPEEVRGSGDRSFRSRPKTHLFW